jgi:hypothetical protein
MCVSCDMLCKKNKTQAGRRRLMSEILDTREAEVRRIVVQDQLGQMLCKTPISKITAAVAQLTERLVCEREALSSNPIPPQKNQTQIKTHKIHVISICL